MIYKPHCDYHNFPPLANGLYLISTTNKTLLRNGNCPVTDPITEMGVAHTATVGQNFYDPLQVEYFKSRVSSLGTTSLGLTNNVSTGATDMVIRVVKFSSGGCNIGKIFT